MTSNSDDIEIGQTIGSSFVNVRGLWEDFLFLKCTCFFWNVTGSKLKEYLRQILADYMVEMMLNSGTITYVSIQSWWG